MLKKRNIAFTGFMGSGKTLLSKEISNIYRLPVCSTDDIIEKEEGTTIQAIFEEKGEEYFRKVEAKVVEALSKKKGIIIDCGGGVILNPENVQNLKNNGIIIYLKSSPESVLKQIKNQGKKRPLLNVDNPLAVIKKMMKDRAAKYEQADFSVDVAHLSLEEITAKVRKIIDE
ncbi:MAG: shikimate kinase [Candidatus Omnitrophica bacterium]|nr:shikimate kinase [Candidatus Omnitrophota bacterium]